MGTKTKSKQPVQDQTDEMIFNFQEHQTRQSLETYYGRTIDEMLAELFEAIQPEMERVAQTVNDAEVYSVTCSGGES